MERSNLSASQVFAAAFARHGVDTVFGQSIPSAFFLSTPEFGIRQCAYRTENAGAVMADAFARISHKVGVVAAQNGPAATLLVAGLAEAMTASSPVVALVQDTPPALAGPQRVPGTGSPGPLQGLFQVGPQDRGHRPHRRLCRHGVPPGGGRQARSGRAPGAGQHHGGAPRERVRPQPVDRSLSPRPAGRRPLPRRRGRAADCRSRAADRLGRRRSPPLRCRRGPGGPPGSGSPARGDHDHGQGRGGRFAPAHRGRGRLLHGHRLRDPVASIDDDGGRRRGRGGQPHEPERDGFLAAPVRRHDTRPCRHRSPGDRAQP